MTALRVQSSSPVRRVRPSPPGERAASARWEHVDTDTHIHTQKHIEILFLVINMRTYSMGHQPGGQVVAQSGSKMPYCHRQ